MGCREDFAELVSIASSIVSSIQQPDPSEAGLFNAPQRPRLRNYQKLASTYTYVPLPSRAVGLFAGADCEK